jgi:hypothetical protein
LSTWTTLSFHAMLSIVCNELCSMYLNIFTTVQIRVWMYPLCQVFYLDRC